MNIFVLDKDIVKSAEYQCDKHCIKMILESAQLLCSAFDQGVAPYRRTHYNHPCSKWIRESISNYKWLIGYGEAMLDEYTYRYGKIHKSGLVIQWCKDHLDELELPEIEMSEFALCMPDEYKVEGNVVESYRRYYMGEKRSIVSWKGRDIPYWWLDA